MNCTLLAVASLSIASSSVLFDSIVKGTALLVLAAVAAAILSRDSAATRHRVWLLAMAAALVVPVLSALLPAVASAAAVGRRSAGSGCCGNEPPIDPRARRWRHRNAAECRRRGGRAADGNRTSTCCRSAGFTSPRWRRRKSLPSRPQEAGTGSMRCRLRGRSVFPCSSCG